MSINIDSIFTEKDARALFENSAMVIGLNLSKQFVMKDIGVTTRVFHHWASKGLIDFKPSRNYQKHIFSFVELIWFNIVNELREFGFPLEKIKIVKNTLMQDFNWTTLINSISEVQKNEMLKDVDNSPEFENQKDVVKEMIKEGLNDPDIVSGDKDIQLNLLFLILFSFLTYRCNVWIYIDNKGNVLPYVDRKPDKAILYQLMEEYHFDSESYVSISLVKFFRKFIRNQKHLEFVRGNNILNETEQYILSIIKEGKAKEITIKFKEEMPYIIKVTEEKKVDAESRLSDVLMKKGYQEIIVKTQDGDIAFSNVTTIIKLK